MDRLLGADIDAARVQALVNAVCTEVALRRRVRVRVNVESVVGAGLRTRFTADTSAVVEVDDAILAGKQRAGWADADAGCVDAVVAAGHLKLATDGRKLATFDVFDPGSIDADGHQMLRLASNRTGVAAYADPVVDYKTVTHECP